MLEPCIQHWVFSSWSLFEPSNFHPHFPPPISWSFQLPTNHPKVCEMPKHESTLKNLRRSKWKFPLPTLQGTSFSEPPLLRQSTRNTLLSRRVFRSEPVAPSPQKVQRAHHQLAAHQILLTQVWAAKSSLFCHFNRAFMLISNINHHNFFTPRFFVSFSWKKRLNVNLYMPSTIDFQRTCHAQTLKLQLKLRLLRAGGSRADGCKWRDVGPLYKWPYKRVSLGFFHA